ncbi:ABC transporter ATP-binding protein [Streptomyces sp. KR80]|uniref:ABC transporter ATP-binding protein n=1 Tax=Streptomyces sp. KR80 TaxID=3457426 RepID=UPI003FD467C1
MSEALLTVDRLTAGYGDAPVLHGVSLSLAPGTVTAVLGANGAGKTTLLRTVSGLVRAESGRIMLGGEDITRMPVERLVRHGLVHVPEGRGLIAELTVDENLRLGGLWRRGHAEARRSLEEVYNLFPALPARRRQPSQQLSGGEQQMLALGRALMARPRLLLLDEPSLGLAPRVTADFMGLLRHLVDSAGLTVLVVEQNVKSALSVADRGVVISLGRVVVAAAADRLRGDNELRHHFLGF